MSPFTSPIRYAFPLTSRTTVYEDLPHPPASYLTTLPSTLPPTATTSVTLSADVDKKKKPQNLKYAARPADGSNYNPLFPDLGKANTPYARTVPSTLQTPLSALPDPGLVFDTLLRRDKFRPHPGGVSGLFFAFADLVIHSIFNTDHSDPTINKSSSYLVRGVSSAGVRSNRDLPCI